MQRLSESQNLALGVLSGGIEVSLLHWMNTLKSFAQQGLPYPRSVRALYRGYPVNCLNMTAATGTQFLFDGALKQLLGGDADGESALSTWVHLSGAFCAGAASGLVVAPVELVMIQQQLYGNTAAHTLRTATANGAIMRGAGLTVARESVSLGYLGICPTVQRELDKRVRPGISVMGGALAGGLVCTTLSHPADTLKTRVQGAALAGREPPSALGELRSLRAAVAGTAGAGAGAGGGSGVIAALFNGFGWRFGRNVLTVLVLDRSRQWLAPAVFRVDCD